MKCAGVGAAKFSKNTHVQCGSVWSKKVFVRRVCGCAKIWLHTNTPIQGSDHCPVSAEFAIIGKNSVKIPTMCTKNFPEFSGNQQKLSTYFNKTKPEKRKLEADSFPVVTEKKKVVAQQKNISSFFIKK